jgi:hypothetical protein
VAQGSGGLTGVLVGIHAVELSSVVLRLIHQLE